MTLRLARFAAVCVVGAGCASLDPILAADGTDSGAGFEAGADTGTPPPDANGSETGSTETGPANPDAGVDDAKLTDGPADGKKGGPPDAMPDVIPDAMPDVVPNVDP